MEEIKPDFDLDALDTVTRSEDGVWMPVKRLGSVEPMLNKNDKPLRVKVLGPDSKKYQQLSRAQLKRALQEQSAAKPGAEQDGDLEALEVLVACTLEWDGFLDRDGAPIPCNAKTVRALYLKYPVIRDQVDRFTANRINFTLA